MPYSASSCIYRIISPSSPNQTLFPPSLKYRIPPPPPNAVSPLPARPNTVLLPHRPKTHPRCPLQDSGVRCNHKNSKGNTAVAVMICRQVNAFFVVLTQTTHSSCAKSIQSALFLFVCFVTEAFFCLGQSTVWGLRVQANEFTTAAVLYAQRRFM